MSDEDMAKEILRYFLRNPRAVDSLEGVAGWRLLEETVHRKVEETQRALRWLVDRGFLREFSSAGAGPIFCLNPNSETEARRFLDSEESPGVSKALEG